MQASQLWNAATRIVELGTRGRPVTAALAQQSFRGCLLVVRRERQRARVLQGHPQLAAHVAVAPGSNPTRQNNADVLILGSGAGLAALRFRNLRHAAQVAIADLPRPGSLLVLWMCLLHWLTGRLARPVRVHVADEWLVVFPVRRRKLPEGARHYVPHALGMAGFLETLRDDNVRHTALRWFEQLPKLPPGEDLDLLVADSDLARVLTLLESGPGVEPCDIYSETGLPRSDFRKMPYYPPRLARQLLDGAVLHNGICRVPSGLHHLLSLVYHAIYHKGPSSGLPESVSAPTARARHDHNYPLIIAALAKKLGVNLEVTREGLDGFLAEHDWRPPRDMLLRLGKRNPWVKASATAEPERLEDRGLAVFIVRAAAMQRGGIEFMHDLLAHHGFTILETKPLFGEDRARVAANVRGGNWGRGPWALSGGEPAAVVVAFDPNPLPLTRKQRKKFPLATNARLLSKSSIRDAFNEGRPEAEHCNVVHSSDNGHEAWEYIALAMPERAGAIKQQLASKGATPASDEVVLADLTRFGRRTRVELLERAGRKLVRKTFKPGCERFSAREALAMRELSPSVPEIPPLLSSTERSVTYPFYDNVLGYERSSGKLMPLEVARQAIAALERVYESGYALIDATIDNVLIDRTEGLKLIDFEFLHRYERRPATFADSYDIAGVPQDFTGDVPAGGAKNYRRNWQPYVGLSLYSLRNDPTWLQHMKRTLYVALRPQRYWPRRLRHIVRQALARDKVRTPIAAPRNLAELVQRQAA